jgi:DNA topoisomerase-1
MPPKKFYKIKKAEDITFNTNAKYLIIVESPSKCKKIEGFLGSEYACIASKGHIRTIDGLKSIDTKKTFEPMFSIIEEKQSHVTFMQSIISKFSKSNIILASDDDREGEAIAWHICKVFDLPVETTKRILFHEITKDAICEAVRNPTVINMHLVEAQKARQVLDIIVGYKISPFLWKYLYHNKTNSLSAGRCQTPALRLVYDNEKEKKSEIETKYKTVGNFSSRNINFDLNYEFSESSQVLDFLEKSKKHNHMINIGSPKESKKSAPKPFNTSRLLQVASNVLHISPKETMSLCQTLYQGGYITYMRTDSQKYSKEFLDKTKKYIVDEWEKAEYIGNMDVLENKDINNPHEAIRPTNIEVRNINDENGRMNSLYKLIWTNTLESCMSDAKYKNTMITIDAPLNKKYEHLIEIPLFLGWKKVTEKMIDTENQNSPSGILLYLKTLETTGKPTTYNKIESTIVVRNKHQHYTEASLINTLEELGIGRPSTFATIVDTIQERGYVKRTDLEGDVIKCSEYKLAENTIASLEREKVFGNEKNKLVIQPLGILTIEFLVQHFSKMFSYDYTKTMEDELDTVSSGEQKEWSKICKDCLTEIKELSKPIAKLEKQVYAIDDEHEFVFERFGQYIRTKNEDGTFEYKPVKKDMKIDLEKLKGGGYELDELYEIKNDYLGMYEEKEMYIKNGKFGPYVEWGENKESIKKIEKPLDQITMEDVLEIIGKDKKKDINILRELNTEYSVRRGKFGSYVYYKTAKMTKPEFYNIKKFPGIALSCEPKELIDWLVTTYKIK